MARRRNWASQEKPKQFAVAFSAIDKMEAVVAYRTVTTNFTTMDVARWLWPTSILEPLLAAWPVARSRQASVQVGPIRTTYVPLSVHLTLQLEPLRMLSPAEDMIQLNPDMERSILPALMELSTIHARFNIVRGVVRWLNDHATPGAARFYCPWLGSLLPVGHPFHEADGSRYKEPATDMTDINRSMRMAGSVVATGLLSDPEHVEITATDLGVQICTTDEQEGQDVRSQRFMLI